MQNPQKGASWQNKQEKAHLLPNSNEEKVNGSDDPDRRISFIRAWFFFIYLLVYAGFAPRTSFSSLSSPARV